MPSSVILTRLADDFRHRRRDRWPPSVAQSLINEIPGCSLRRAVGLIVVVWHWGWWGCLRDTRSYRPCYWFAGSVTGRSPGQNVPKIQGFPGTSAVGLLGMISGQSTNSASTSTLCYRLPLFEAQSYGEERSGRHAVNGLGKFTPDWRPACMHFTCLYRQCWVIWGREITYAHDLTLTMRGAWLEYGTLEALPWTHRSTLPL